MACPDFEKLYSYILGEIEEEECEALRNHLENCKACKAKSKELEEDIEKIKLFLGNYEWNFFDEDGDSSSGKGNEEKTESNKKSVILKNMRKDFKGNLFSPVSQRQSIYISMRMWFKNIYFLILKKFLFKSYSPAQKITFAAAFASIILIFIFSLSFLSGRVTGNFLRSVKYRTEIALSSENPAPYYEMGLIMREKNNIADARKLLEKAYLINHNYAVSYCDFGDGYQAKLKKVVIFSNLTKNENCLLSGFALSTGDKLSLIRTLSPEAVETLNNMAGENAIEKACRMADSLGGDYLLFLDDLSNKDSEWSLKYKLIKIAGNQIISQAFLSSPSLTGLEFQLVLETAEILCGKITSMEEDIIKKYSFNSEKAFEFYLEGRGHYYRYTEEDNRKAINLFREALEIDPNSALTCAALADSMTQEYGLFSKDDKELLKQSMEYSKKAIMLDPALAEAYKSRGLTFAYEGKSDEAIKEYEKALELNENYTEAYINLGMIYLNAKSYKVAVSMFKKALHTNSSSPEAYKELANSYLFMRDYENAEKSYRKALEIGFLNSHSLFQTYNNIALCYRADGTYDKALENLKKAFELRPDEGKISFELAEVAGLAGKKKDAELYYRAYLELEPDGEYSENAEKTLKLLEENKGRAEGLIDRGSLKDISGYKVVFKESASSDKEFISEIDDRGFYSLILPEGTYKYIEIKSEDNIAPLKPYSPVEIISGRIKSFDIYIE